MDLEEFRYGGTNITAFRLVDPESPTVSRTVSEWQHSELRTDKKTNALLVKSFASRMKYFQLF